MTDAPKVGIEELKKETLPSLSSKTKASSVGKRPTWKQLQTAYQSYPPVFRAINIRANEIMARGYELLSQDPKALEDVQGLFSRISFNSRIYQTVINTYAFGDGYDEIVKEGAEWTDLALIHPGTMDFTRDGAGNIVFDDETGKPESYTQQVGTEKKEDIDPNTIFHLVFNKIADEWKGISLIEPMYRTVTRVMNIEEGMAQAIWRLGFPFIHQKIGSDLKQPTKPMIEDAAKEIQGLNAKSDITTPYYYDIKIVEAQEMKGIEKYTDPFINLICSCTAVPKFILMGTGEGTNKATSQEHSRHFRYSIETDQAEIKTAVEQQIIARYLVEKGYDLAKSMVFLEWNELAPEIDDAKVANVVSLFETNIITKEEAREMLNLTAIPPKPASEEKPTESPADSVVPNEEPEKSTKPKTEGEKDEDNDIGNGTEP